MDYQLLKIKKEITLDDLIDFWFNNPKIWFNCSKEDDNFIKEMFSDLLINCNNIIYPTNVPNKNTFLGKIILYDQISRHIYRDNKEEIKKYDILAYKYSLILLPIIETFKPEERCFILMPFRHTFDQFNLELCLDYINKWLTENNTAAIYRRFYQATVTALANVKNKNNTLYVGDIHFIPEHIYDADSYKIDYNYRVNINKIVGHKLYNEFCKYINIKKGNVIISLSGGVDSMVCSLLLYIYSIQNKNIKPIAVCINYTNRSDQYFEVEMVYKWTKILGIEFHVREISEIQREICKEINSRDFYEKITKNIRFETYKKFTGSPVILGHNRDDCMENIFANIIKKKNYNNLLGMSHKLIENDVEILRPLLNITKAEIFDFAEEFRVPYTYDSTPKWADRAKMRDVLIPQIKDFNPLILDGLIELSNNFKEIYSVYNKCMPNIIYEEKYCIVENKDIFFLDYWKNIFTKISLHYKLPFIKNKSVQYFIDNIKSGNRITLNIHFVACLKKNNICIYVR
jgi:tRNA(Ile)-lysidine synthetase-like protein